MTTLTRTRLLTLALTACILLSATPACSADQKDSGSDRQEVFAISNDISNLRITAMAEDDCGHIWLGTFRGLNKYTGQEYHQYFCNDDSLSIPDNQIKSLFRDSKGRLWVGTVNGMAEYTRQDNFRVYKLESYSKNVQQILESPSGKIFVNAISSLCVLNPQTNVFETALADISTGNSYNDRCFFAPSGELWIANSNSLRSYDPDSMVLKDSIAVEGYPNVFQMTSDGKLILGGHLGLEIFNTGSHTFEDVPTPLSHRGQLAGKEITHLHPYGYNALIICTREHGVYLYSRLTQTLLHESDKDFPFEVPDFRINAFFTDSQENLWIGSYDQGFSVVFTYKSRFNWNEQLRRATENTSITSMARDSRGRIYMSLLKGGGLKIYDPVSKRVSDIDLNRIGFYIGREFSDISAVFVDSRDNIWLGGGTALLRCTYNDDQGLKVADRYDIFFPLCITEDKGGNIWVGTASSYLLYIPNGSREIKVCTPFTMDFTFVSALYPVGDNVLVAAFGQPLMLASAQSDKLTKANVDSQDWEECIRRSVFIPTSLMHDSDGKVWIGTVANGLLLYDPQTGHIRPMEGESCTDISSIEEDDHGNIWISTQYGLGKYDRDSDRFLNWFATDGTGGNQFYDRSSCRLPDGSIVFGGTHGITCFNPIDIGYRRDVSVFFEGLKVHNNIVKADDGKCISLAMPYGPDIVLGHDQNSFSISFAALDYGEYERVHYFYCLEGFDRHWIDAHNNREAYYANLPYGKYTFKVKVTNYDQTLVQGENSISLTIMRPWWLSWWMRVVYVLLAIAFVAAVLRVRKGILADKRAKRAAEEEKEREKKVNEMNMTYFANISHEFRTPLTMISGPISQLSEAKEITPEHKRLLDIVTRNVRRMLGLVNQLLDFHKLESKGLGVRAKEFDLIRMMRYLAEICQVSATEKGINFRTYGIEESLTVCNDEDKLDKICNNLLSNALKYTLSGGTVEFCLDVVSLEEASKLSPAPLESEYRHWVKIQVKDSGPGIPEDELEKVFERYYQLENQNSRSGGSYNWGTGIGLYYARALAELCHGRLWAGNRQECRGSVFTLVVPANLPPSEAGADSPAPQEQSSHFPKGTDNGGITAVVYEEQPLSEDSGQTILVVDDDPDVAYYLRELLSPRFKVVVRFDADSAYTAMKEELPDIVISDVVMPVKDGYELCRQVKDDIQLSHVPVILLTAKATVENQVEGLGCGADAYVTKPFEPKYLLALIESLIRNREKIRCILGQSTAVEETASQALSPQDNAFMEELYNLMEQNLSNAELDIAGMTEMLHISRTKFYYKVKGLTGYNPAAFFRRYKLNRAAKLLRSRQYNVSEIADLTGFSTLSHFSVSFKKQFGVSPSEYIR